MNHPVLSAGYQKDINFCKGSNYSTAMHPKSDAVRACQKKGGWAVRRGVGEKDTSAWTNHMQDSYHESLLVLYRSSSVLKRKSWYMNHGFLMGKSWFESPKVATRPCTSKRSEAAANNARIEGIRAAAARIMMRFGKKREGIDSRRKREKKTNNYSTHANDYSDTVHIG